jgi:hypothetical protein
VCLQSLDVRDNAGVDDMPGDAAFSALQVRLCRYRVSLGF